MAQNIKYLFELPHSVARLFNIVKNLGSATTAVLSVVHIVYDFVRGSDNNKAVSVNHAISRQEVDRVVAFVDNFLFMYPQICRQDSFSSLNTRIVCMREDVRTCKASISFINCSI